MTQTDSAGTQLERLRGLVTAATQRLLGDTISVSDEDWRGPVSYTHLTLPTTPYV